MSGLTRTATRARPAQRAAIASTRANSPADSTLIAFRPSGDGAFELGIRLSDAGEHDVLRVRSPRGAPASISQIEFASAALPSCCSSAAIANVELALSA